MGVKNNKRTERGQSHKTNCDKTYSISYSSSPIAFCSTQYTRYIIIIVIVRRRQKSLSSMACPNTVGTET